MLHLYLRFTPIQLNILKRINLITMLYIFNKTFKFEL